MNLHPRLHVLQDTDLRWNFSQEGPAFWTLPVSGEYASQIQVDPFPCYTHDPELVSDLIAQVECPSLKVQPHYYLTPFEFTGRTNGYASQDHMYGEEKPHPWTAHIVLSGKRIPLHPAMTRYLVSHEYGHVLQWALQDAFGMKEVEFETHYAEVRGLPGLNTEYGGRKWHANTGELFANDFRILITGIEREFWPHPGFPRPEAVPGLAEFWHGALQRLQAP